MTRFRKLDRAYVLAHGDETLYELRDATLKENGDYIDAQKWRILTSGDKPAERLGGWVNRPGGWYLNGTFGENKLFGMVPSAPSDLDRVDEAVIRRDENRKVRAEVRDAGLRANMRAYKNGKAAGYAKGLREGRDKGHRLGFEAGKREGREDALRALRSVIERGDDASGAPR